MDQLNEQLETILLKRHVTNAVLLVSKVFLFPKRYIICFIIASLAFVWCFEEAVAGHRVSLTNWVLGLLFLISPWVLVAFLYLLLRARTLSRIKLSLNHPIRYDLNNDRLSVCYFDGLKRELLWSEVTKYMKSSEVTVLYAAGRKAFIFSRTAYYLKR
jgi:hypothetical protein